MTGTGSIPTTRGLLDGAVLAGWSATDGEAISTHACMGPLRWALRLVCLYHTTHATPGLMAEAADRFARAGRHALAEWARTKATEERGHDVLALRDLVELGYDAPALVSALVPDGPAALVEYFEQSVRQDDPVGCVGYSYALERLALELDAGFVAAVEASLPAGVRATRCLRVHSAAGSDRDHVEGTIETVASLSAQERTRIALACHETATLCGRSRRDDLLDPPSIQRRLTPHARALPRPPHPADPLPPTR